MVGPSANAIVAAAGQAVIKAVPHFHTNPPTNPRLIQVTHAVIREESVRDINNENTRRYLVGIVSRPPAR